MDPRRLGGTDILMWNRAWPSNALKVLVEDKQSESHMTKLPVNGRRTDSGEHTTAGGAGAWDCLYCWIGDRACAGGTNSFTAISGGKRASATENGTRMVLLQQNEKLPRNAGRVERSWDGGKPTGRDWAVLCFT